MMGKKKRKREKESEPLSVTTINDVGASLGWTRSIECG
jgi:hypothetical protein